MGDILVATYRQRPFRLWSRCSAGFAQMPVVIANWHIGATGLQCSKHVDCRGTGDHINHCIERASVHVALWAELGNFWEGFAYSLSHIAWRIATQAIKYGRIIDKHGHE